MAVESGVSEQPVGFAEIVAGARGRARAAFASGACELAVGYEDGLVEIPGTARALVQRRLRGGGRTRRAKGLGFSSGFAYPAAPAPSARPRSARRSASSSTRSGATHRRAERRAAPSALSVGNVGKLTRGALPRADYARHAVLCALVSFLHPDLYRARGETP